MSEKSIETLLAEAQAGNVESAAELALRYYNGDGVAQDYVKAVEWWSCAAVAGNATAQCNLGYCYEFGKGVAEDKTKAVEWYKKGAEMGSLSCSYKLGLMYSRGDGVEKNEDEAAKYFLQAANNSQAFQKEKINMAWYGEQQGAKRELAKIYLSKARKLLFQSAFFDFDPLATPEGKNILNFSLAVLKNGSKNEVEILGYYFLELARTLFEKSEEKEFGSDDSLNAFAQSRTKIVRKKYGVNNGKTFKFEDLDDFLKYLSEISTEKGDTEIQKQIETIKNFEKNSE